MTAPADIAARLVARLEGKTGARAHHARAEVYPLLAAAGVDVEKLAGDAIKAAVAERRGRLAEKLARRKLVKAQVDAGRLDPTKAAEAEERLRAVAADIAAQRRELKAIVGRKLPPMPSHAAPTRELVRHQGAPVAETVDDRGDPLTGPRYRWRWSIDRMAVSLTAEEYAAAERLRRAWSLRQNTVGAVDWGRTGASVPGSRLPIRDEQLAAGLEVDHVTRHLPWALRGIIANFVLEQAPRGRDRPLDAVEFGRLYAQVQDAATARGVAHGAIRCAVQVVAELLDGYDRRRIEAAREQKRRRLTEGGR